MRYCAGCGKQIATTYYLNLGKLAYHRTCAPAEDAPIAPVIPIRATERNRAHLETLHSLAGELESLLALVNQTPLVIVKCENPKK